MTLTVNVHDKSSEDRSPFVLQFVPGHDGIDDYCRLIFDEITVFITVERLRELQSALGSFLDVQGRNSDVSEPLRSIANQFSAGVK